MVSRKHAQITFRNGNYLIEDNNSFNGTLVNEQRISAPTPLYDGNEIRLGIGGPVLRFASPARVAPKGASLPRAAIDRDRPARCVLCRGGRAVKNDGLSVGETERPFGGTKIWPNRNC